MEEMKSDFVSAAYQDKLESPGIGLELRDIRDNFPFLAEKILF